MMKEELIQDIRHFLTRGDKSLVIANDDNLFTEGYLDSMGVFEIIEMIEEKTGKEFDPESLVADNISTLEKIEVMIDQML